MFCVRSKTTYTSEGATIQFPGGGGWSFFEINNFRRTLRKTNNLLQELFSAPPSRVEINNLPATKNPPPPPLDIELWPPNIHPANTRRSHYPAKRCWTNVKSTLIQRIVFTGYAGPASQTVEQHWPSIAIGYRVVFVGTQRCINLLSNWHIGNYVSPYISETLWRRYILLSTSNKAVFKQMYSSILDEDSKNKCTAQYQMQTV